MAKLKLPPVNPLGAAKARLWAAGLDIEKVVTLPHGWNLYCATGEVASVYATGSVVVGGRRTGAVERAFGTSTGDVRGPVEAPKAARSSAPVSLVPKDGSVMSNKGTESGAARRHPEWSDEPWDGVTVPF